jgi:hypothetical protein
MMSKHWMRRLLAVVASAFCCGLSTAAMDPDPTGLWFDPAESGWGLTLAQQGDTVFAVLFVYDSTNHPVWYAASDLRAPASNPPGGPEVAGTLYRTAGPWFGGPFDPHAVSVTPVGTLTLHYAEPARQSLQVGYVIDGIAVSKSVQPETWGDGSAALFGTYEGGLRITGKSSAACDDIPFAPTDTSRAFNFQVIPDAPGHLHLIWGTGIDTLCLAVGQYAQHGQRGFVTGAIACGPAGTIANAAPSQLTLADLLITEHGFAGAATAQRGSCTYTGHIGGVRRP